MLNFFMKNYRRIAGIVVICGVVIGVLVIVFSLLDRKTLPIPQEPGPSLLDFRTDFSQSSVPTSSLISVGVRKDGIPSISEPQFVSITSSTASSSEEGLFVDIRGDQRFYPISVLSRYYIVNDTVGGEPVAISYHPLSGTGIVVSRVVGSTTLVFGVSGFVYEANMVMFDAETESLWSQSKREAVAGDFTGTRLSFFDTQHMTFRSVQTYYPNVQVLVLPESLLVSPNEMFPDHSTTGTSPFPVTYSDLRYPYHEQVYVIPYREVSIAIPVSIFDIEKSLSLAIYNVTLEAQKKNGKIIVTVDNTILPGYREAWFSWITEHQQDGVIWDLPSLR